jgi:hypothetical protein
MPRDCVLEPCGVFRVLMLAGRLVDLGVLVGAMLAVVCGCCCRVAPSCATLLRCMVRYSRCCGLACVVCAVCMCVCWVQWCDDCPSAPPHLICSSAFPLMCASLYGPGLTRPDDFPFIVMGNKCDVEADKCVVECCVWMGVGVLPPDACGLYSQWRGRGGGPRHRWSAPYPNPAFCSVAHSPTRACMKPCEVHQTCVGGHSGCYLLPPSTTSSSFPPPPPSTRVPPPLLPPLRRITVPEARAKEVCAEHGVPHFRVSAKEGRNVDQAFLTVVKAALKRPRVEAPIPDSLDLHTAPPPKEDSCPC